jgi:tRNA pseudouridine38-40 synthase
MRIALGLEYDGRAFCGWQHQPGGCGAQDHLEAALARFVGAPVEVVAAGRTDAGVHAAAQVVHVDSPVSRKDYSWVRGPNSFLDDRLRVLWARQVPEEFHARYSARSRTYRYLLLNEPVAPGLWHGRVGWFHRHLDEDAMARAAQMLLGEHDFSAFRDAECQARTPVRTMHEATVARAGSLVVFSFRANAFLHHMVRNLVGTLVYVGAGRQEPAWVGELIAARDRTRAAPTFAPDGLYLAAIEYDSAFDLPAFRPDPLLAGLVR